LLVIAGLHVGLLGMLAEYLLRIFGLRETWRSVLILIILAGYAAIVEQRAPTLRATLMISIYLLARIYRQHSALNAIGLAGLVLLLVRPAWLFESGFQLSFAAALIIVGLAGPVLERTTEPYRRALWALDELDLDPALQPRQAQFRIDLRMVINALKRRSALVEAHPRAVAALVTSPVRLVLWAANIFLFSAILQFGLLLPMAEIFHRVTYARIGLNAVAVPVVTVLLAIAVPAVILATALPAVAVWGAKPLTLLMQALFALTDLPRLPLWLSYRTLGPPTWVGCGFALSIVAAACTLSRSRLAFRNSIAALACFGLLISLHPFAPRFSNGSLEVTALDCGPGEALFAVLPDRSTMLIGTGTGRAGVFDSAQGVFARRRWDLGGDGVSPYLWSRGLKAIDVLVLTTAGQASGAAAILDNFRVGEIWYAGFPRNKGVTWAYALPLMLAKARQRGIRLREIAPQDTFSRGGAWIKVLPSSRAAKVIHDRNGGDSLNLRIAVPNATSALMAQNESNAREEWGSFRNEDASATAPGPAIVVDRNEITLVAPSQVLARIIPGTGTIPTGDLLETRLHDSSAKQGQPEGTPFHTETDGAVTFEISSDGLRIRSYAHPCGPSLPGMRSPEAVPRSSRP
jgi:competence protein ComEC